MTHEWLTRKDAAKYIGINDRTLEKIILRGSGPNRYQITKKAFKFLKSDLDAWIKSNRIENDKD